MSHVTSRDATTIAYSQSGDGPALILLDGALCSRAFGPRRGAVKYFMKDMIGAPAPSS
jgi:hypothetical protein